jgi:hypothetical protein
MASGTVRIAAITTRREGAAPSRQAAAGEHDLSLKNDKVQCAINGPALEDNCRGTS